MLFSSVGAAQFNPARKGWEPVSSSIYRSRCLSRDSPSFELFGFGFSSLPLRRAWFYAPSKNKKGAPISRSALYFPCGLLRFSTSRPCAVCASRIILRGRRRVQVFSTSRPYRRHRAYRHHRPLRPSCRLPSCPLRELRSSASDQQSKQHSEERDALLSPDR